MKRSLCLHATLYEARAPQSKWLVSATALLRLQWEMQRAEDAASNVKDWDVQPELSGSCDVKKA